jgi:hypothetical protein
LESIAEEPRRLGFDTFDELMAFRRATLLEQDPELRDKSRRHDPA